MTTLATVPKTKIGVRFHVMPRARSLTTVVVMFIPATPVEMAKRMIVTRKRVHPALALVGQRGVGGPAGRDAADEERR